MRKSELVAIATTKTPEAKRERPKLAMNWDDNNVLHLSLSGDFKRLDRATRNLSVSTGLLNQIALLGSQESRMDEGASNFALGFIDTMEPKDAAEALLCTQMAAMHQATMMMARRLNHVDNITQQDAAERALNKLTRSYAAQMDTLKRYRSKGQTVRVERVNVENGGQAIVGNVSKGGATDEK